MDPSPAWLLVLLGLLLIPPAEQTLQAWYSFDDTVNFTANYLVPVQQGNCPPRTDLGSGSGYETPVLVPGIIGMGLRTGSVVNETGQTVDLGPWNIGAQNNQYTLSVWVNIEAYSTSGFIVKASGSTFSSLTWGIGLVNGVLPKFWYSLLSSPGATFFSTVVPALHVWHHVAVTWDGSEVIGYVNGSVQDAVSQIGQRFAEPLGVDSCISNFQKKGNKMFNGTIDEVRIYDNALSAAEIQDLFDLRTTQRPPTLQVPSAVMATALTAITISANATTYNGAPPSFSWSVASGPCAAAIFENASASDVTVSFNTIQPFTLQVEVTDGTLCAFSDVSVTVDGLSPAISLNGLGTQAYVYQGENSTLTVSVTGFPVPVIQWETPGLVTVFETSNITNNTVVTNETVPGWVPIDGAKSSTYITPPGTPSLDGMVIRVTASNFVDTVSSPNITLKYSTGTTASSNTGGDGGSSSTTGIIVGTVVGAFVLCCLVLLLLLLVLLVVLVVRRRQHSRLGGRKLVRPDFEPLIFHEFLESPAKKADLTQLRDLLLAEDMMLVDAIEGLLDADRNVAYALVFTFEAQNRSAQRLLEHFIAKELRVTNEEGTMFRSDSTAVRLFQPYSKLVAMEYIWNLLAQMVNDLNDLNSAQGDDDEDASDHSSSRKSIGLFNMNMEVDPKKLDEASDPEVNTLQLWLIVQKLFVAITRNYNEVPGEISKILLYVKEEVAQKFPDSEYSAMGGFYFLRCISLALIAPHLYGILDRPPHQNTQRQLILITKVLQNLANGTLPGQKEGYMIKLNTFITDNQEGLHRFFDRITESPGAYSTEEIPDNVQKNALLFLHDFILEHRKPVEQRLRGSGGDLILEQLDTALRKKAIKRHRSSSGGNSSAVDSAA